MRAVGLAALLLVFSAGDMVAQKKKEIKKNKIKSVTIYSSDPTGKEFKESFMRYDGSGNVLEEAEFKSDGSVVKKELNKYNKASEKTEHIIYAGAAVKKKVVTIYNAENVKIGEEEYDPAGKLLKKEVFSFNSLGDKVSEIKIDGNGKLLEKAIYVYNSKGLKSEKKVYDGNGKLLYTKRYSYEY